MKFHRKKGLCKLSIEIFIMTNNSDTQKNPLHIAFCIGDSYMPHLYACVISILVNNRNLSIKFNILSSDLSDENKSVLKNLESLFKNCSFEFYKVDKTLFNEEWLKIPHISVETYYRYLLPQILTNVDKVLYLDADIIVNGDISPLKDFDMSDYIAAGAKDFFIEKIGYKKNLGIPAEKEYINAGVLLLNLNQMRKESTTDLLMKYTTELSDKIEYQDQDVINVALQNRILLLNIIYNFASSNVRGESEKTKHAVIIHYNGPRKPWRENCKNPLRSLYPSYVEIGKEILTGKLRDSYDVVSPNRVFYIGGTPALRIEENSKKRIFYFFSFKFSLRKLRRSKVKN